MDNLSGLLGIMRTDRALNARIKELYGEKNGEDKRLMKVFSEGFSILKEW